MGESCVKLANTTGRCQHLSERQWQAIKPLLPGKSGDPGRTAVDNRKFVDAVLWVLSTRTQWNQLPASFGSYKSVHKRYKRWQKKGIWGQVFAQLRRDLETGLPVLSADVHYPRVSKQQADSVFDLSIYP